jgi:hypothetical protein
MLLDNISILDVFIHVFRDYPPRHFSFELRGCVGKSLFDLPFDHLFESLINSNLDGKLAYPALAV